MPVPFALVPAAYVYLFRAGADGTEVLLQQRQHTGYMDGHWVAGAAGHVEPAETAAGCAVREALEEIGVTIAEEDLRPLTVMQRRNGDAPVEQRVDWYFSCERWSGVPAVQEPEKCAGLRWAPLAQLPSPVPAYERAVLEGVLRGDLPVLTHHGLTGYGLAE
ncbi:hypothetical protein GCM10011519_34310 [Marmoricola endophyticus]|uniref:Nudix hydrolase domain-containing protein n=1 Tax=Marmoricola endophyticus TaxID=2040280 RepID=A0A917F924_9ACTN|nr:NUDIX domain-containing protein [Marmoricola endophyticus]GGF57496.1 hypothetical protein GCM10011519_34310 [Marmoricola endophyticus]